MNNTKISRTLSIFIVLIAILFTSACTNSGMSKISDEERERVMDTVVCNPPYMKLGLGCCLDQNNNSICDQDESIQTICQPPYIEIFDSCCLDVDNDTNCDSETLVVNKTVLEEKNTDFFDERKLDKPYVELFVMSRCPYASQAERGLLPVVEQLGETIDFRVRFIFYIMHGEEELRENVVQYCIQKMDKKIFLQYLDCYLRYADQNKCIAEANVDREYLYRCTIDTDKRFDITKNWDDKTTWLSGRYALFNIDARLNEKYKIQASPTLIVNGKETNSDRDPNSYLKTICKEFDKKPIECDAELSTKIPPAGIEIK